MAVRAFLCDNLIFACRIKSQIRKFFTSFDIWRILSTVCSFVKYICMYHKDVCAYFVRNTKTKDRKETSEI